MDFTIIFVFIVSKYSYTNATLCTPNGECGGHGGSLEGVEGLGDDEDVVDADAEEDEGDDGVGRGVKHPEQRAHPVTQDHAHEHAAANRQC